MTVSLIIKQAEATDKTYIFNLYCDAMKQHIENIWGWNQSWQENNFELSWKTCFNYMLIYKGEKIGYIQTIEREIDIYIEMLILESNHRSIGLGQEVIFKLVQLYLNKPFSLRVFKTNHRALSFYTKNGFQVTGKEESFYVLHRNSI